jgi:uncharacterized protein YndB with AHSA1/START domain
MVMRAIIEKIVIEIKAPVEKVFQFLVDYDKHYTSVHQDHIERVVNIKDPDLEHPDVSFYFRQISPITGKEQKIRGKVTRVEMNRYIGTRFLFPTSLVLSQVENVLEPKWEDCLLTTNLHFTFLAHFIKKSIKKIVEHITEEHKEMKRILESQPNLI